MERHAKHNKYIFKHIGTHFIGQWSVFATNKIKGKWIEKSNYDFSHFVTGWCSRGREILQGIPTCSSETCMVTNSLFLSWNLNILFIKLFWPVPTYWEKLTLFASGLWRTEFRCGSKLYQLFQSLWKLVFCSVCFLLSGVYKLFSMILYRNFWQVIIVMLVWYFKVRDNIAFVYSTPWLWW